MNKRNKATSWSLVKEMGWSRGGAEVLKIVANSFCFTLVKIRRKLSRAKGNPSLQILEYSTPHQKFKTQIWISNFVGTKFSCWHLKVNLFWHQLGSPLEYFCWHLGIISFWRELGYLLGLDIPGDSSRGFLFAFPCWFLLCLSFREELHISVMSLLCFYFCGELHQSPKGQDCLLYPLPISQLRIHSRLK